MYRERALIPLYINQDVLEQYLLVIVILINLECNKMVKVYVQ